MRASSRRLLTFLVSLGFLVGSFVTYSSFLKPEYLAVQRLRGTLASKEDLLERQTEILDKVRALLTKYQGAARIQDVVSLALPSDPDTHILFYQLLNIGKVQSGAVTVSGVSVNPVAPLKSGTSKGRPSSVLPKIGTVQASLSVTGSYEEVKKFFQIIETNIRILDVISAGFTPVAERREGRGERREEGEAPAAPAGYAASLSLRAYYQSSSPAAAPRR